MVRNLFCCGSRGTLWSLPTLLLFSALLAFAETVELITYAPSQSQQLDNLHVETLTVGVGYLDDDPLPNEMLVEGNVGIGTTNPGTTLHLISTAALPETMRLDRFDSVAAGANSFWFRHADGNPLAPSALAPGGTLGSIAFQGRSGSGFVPGSDIEVQVQGAWVPGSTPSRVVFRNGNAEAMRITDPGRVGIRETNPQAALHVTSRDAFLDTILFDRFDSSPVAENGLWLGHARGTQALPTFLQGADRLGSLIFFGQPDFGTGANPVEGAQISAVAEADWLLGATPASLTFLTGSPSSERMRLTSSGNVGVGTTNPFSLNGSNRVLEISAQGTGPAGKPSLVLRAGTQYTGNPAWEILLGEASPTEAFLAFASGDNNLILTLRRTPQAGIGTTNPSSGALLELSSTSRGFLLPRMNTADRDNIPGPLPAGLAIYNTDTKTLQLYNGTTWASIGARSSNQWDLFTSRSTVRRDFTGGGWQKVESLPAGMSMSVPNVALLQGDVVRLTFSGDYLVSSSNNDEGAYSQLRFTFNGVQYGPFMDLGSYESSSLPRRVYQWGYPFTVTLRCGTGAGEVPPGTYTIALEVLANAFQNGVFRVGPHTGGEYILYVERIRS